ncbi:MAG TPA: hypothetical protein VF829_00360 [Candidatus Paceibacterota bacterium]
MISGEAQCLTRPRPPDLPRFSENFNVFSGPGRLTMFGSDVLRLQEAERRRKRKENKGEDPDPILPAANHGVGAVLSLEAFIQYHIRFTKAKKPKQTEASLQR